MAQSLFRVRYVLLDREDPASHVVYSSVLATSETTAEMLLLRIPPEDYYLPVDSRILVEGLVMSGMQEHVGKDQAGRNIHQSFEVAVTNHPVVKAEPKTFNLTIASVICVDSSRLPPELDRSHLADSFLEVIGTLENGDKARVYIPGKPDKGSMAELADPRAVGVVWPVTGAVAFPGNVFCAPEVGAIRVSPKEMEVQLLPGAERDIFIDTGSPSRDSRAILTGVFRTTTGELCLVKIRGKNPQDIHSVLEGFAYHIQLDDRGGTRKAKVGGVEREMPFYEIRPEQVRLLPMAQQAAFSK